MRHHVRNCHQFAGGTVHGLPDGRRLVSEFNGTARVVDLDGNEMTPSLSEVAALTAIAGMAFPRKSAHGKKLLRLQWG
jgi:hypothetical protein